MPGSFFRLVVSHRIGLLGVWDDTLIQQSVHVAVKQRVEKSNDVIVHQEENH